MSASQDDPNVPRPALRLRITHITSTQAAPIGPFTSYYRPPQSQATAFPPGVLPDSLPVLRIFGTTPALQKICANVHLCFPYFYVPFPMDIGGEDPLSPENVNKIAFRFGKSLNHAICLASRQDPYSAENVVKYGGSVNPKHLHVVSVSIVKGIPFYGYHIGYSYFLKVSLVSPSRMYVAMEQLRKPVVLGRVWQPHEAHLNHLLQFMADFDLYGCGWLDIETGKFREPLPPGDPYDPPTSSEDVNSRIFDDRSTPQSMLFRPGTSPAKETFAPLEIDILPNHIINRMRLTSRHLHHDFVELLKQPLDPYEKLVRAMKELWEDEKRRRVAKGLSVSEEDMMPKEHQLRTPAELGYLTGNEPENRGGNWHASEELWEDLQSRMHQEKTALGGSWDFEGFAKAANEGKNGRFRRYEKWIMTTFEAVAAHWPKLKPISQQIDASENGFPASTGGEEENPFTVYSQQQRDADDYDQQQASADIDVKFLTQMDDEHFDMSGEMLADFNRENDFDDPPRANVDDDSRQEVGIDGPEAEELFRQMIHSQSREAHEIRASQKAPATPDSMHKAGVEDLDEFWLVTPSPNRENPYLVNPVASTRDIDDGPTTPRSLARNRFSLPRPTMISPLKTPSKPSKLRINTVLLPVSRRTFSTSPTSPSPESPTLPTVKTTSAIGDEANAKTSEKISPQSSHVSLNPFCVSGKPTVIPETVWSPTLLDNPVEGATPVPSFTPTQLSTQVVEGRSHDVNTEEGVNLAPSRSTSPSPVKSVDLLVSSAASSSQELSRTAWVYASRPPRLSEVAALEDFGLPSMIYRPPYYSEPHDVPARPKVFAGRQFHLKGNSVADLEAFQHITDFEVPSSRRHLYDSAKVWEYAPLPPRCSVVSATIAREDAEVQATKIRAASQIDAPTQKSKYGFKFSQKIKTKASQRQHQNMSVMALEIFAPSRDQLLPDPEKDAIAAIFYCYQNEDYTLDDTTKHEGYHAGYVVIGDHHTEAGRAMLNGIPCHYVDSELDLFNWVVDTVKAWDPDVLAGWELHNSSWGYLASRAESELAYDICDMISRVRIIKTNAGRPSSIYDATHTTTFKVAGRHILNIWRILRSEYNLTSYTFENVVFHVLRQRIQRLSSQSLTALWRSKNAEHTVRVMSYYFERVVKYVELLDTAEVVTKNAEFARVFGVDFASVLTRGSQYKVESFMIRIAKPESFVLVSPSKQQVGLQNAPDAIPLIAEPESKYYNHPIVVLDFQSLYPSVMIAYNLCYSTCLGRVRPFKGTWKFGFDELRLPKGTLELLQPYLTVSPNGMVFVKPAVRKSCLAKMLGEILDTRVMIKTAMKAARNDKALTQLLNARQLGLKLMANVTYGYTSATFSGRMPCIEIADSIVQLGRETLMKAHDLIHSRSDWGAQVVYGDTDSLFLSLPGKTKEQAFKIGNDIADTVTALNPKPVKLKFEKVYMGSVLMAKKRYVGNKFEHIDDAVGVFDAKGIETVRRDGFPAQSKLEEICLKKLFTSQDLSQVKAQCQQEWSKIIQGKVSLQDFIIAKEVRLGSYSENSVPPAGATVATRRLINDPRDEAQYAERVPYLITAGEGSRLIDRARTPEEMLADRSLRLDTEYYIRKGLIPCLSRIFNLIGADVESWYNTMSKTYRVNKFELRKPKNGKIDGHFRSSHCINCGVKSDQTLCASCRSSPADTTFDLMSKIHMTQERLIGAHRLCASCSSTPVAEPVLCNSIDCPVLYARVKAEWEAEDGTELQPVIKSLSNETIEW